MEIEEKINTYLNESADVKSDVDKVLKEISSITDEMVIITRNVQGENNRIVKDAIRSLNNASYKLTKVKNNMK